MQREQIDNLWRDRTNWSWGVVYHCAEDPRVIVPRRWRWGGWTLNFAHRRAGLYGVLAVLFCVGPAVLSLWLLGAHPANPIVLLLSVAGVILWAHWESGRTG